MKKDGSNPSYHPVDVQTLEAVSSDRCRWRTLLSGIAILVTVITVVMTLQYRITSVPAFETTYLDDATKEAIGIRREQSQILYQSAGLSIAAILGLFIAKKDEVRLLFSDRPETIMTLLGCFLLVASIWFHFQYLGAIENVYFSARRIPAQGQTPAQVIIASIRDPKIDYLLVFQWRLLIGGGVIALLTLFSTHILKEKTS